jgi:hypothetical protein
VSDIPTPAQATTPSGNQAPSASAATTAGDQPASGAADTPKESG